MGSGTKAHYIFDMSRSIVLTCCIFHNFLCRVDNDQTLVDEVDKELMDRQNDRSTTQDLNDDYREDTNLRHMIA